MCCFVWVIRIPTGSSGKERPKRTIRCFPKEISVSLQKLPSEVLGKCPISVFRLEKLCETLPLRAAGTDLEWPRRGTGRWNQAADILTFTVTENGRSACRLCGNRGFCGAHPNRLCRRNKTSDTGPNCSWVGVIIRRNGIARYRNKFARCLGNSLPLNHRTSVLSLLVLLFGDVLCGRTARPESLPELLRLKRRVSGSKG